MSRLILSLPPTTTTAPYPLRGPCPSLHQASHSSSGTPAGRVSWLVQSHRAPLVCHVTTSPGSSTAPPPTCSRLLSSRGWWANAQARQREAPPFPKVSPLPWPRHPTYQTNQTTPRPFPQAPIIYLIFNNTTLTLVGPCPLTPANEAAPTVTHSRTHPPTVTRLMTTPPPAYNDSSRPARVPALAPAVARS